LDYFLGLEIKHQPNGSLLLTQAKYISDLLSKTDMSDANPVTTPVVSILTLNSLKLGLSFADASQFSL
jgi:hypothetical protein